VNKNLRRGCAGAFDIEKDFFYGCLNEGVGLFAFIKASHKWQTMPQIRCKTSLPRLPKSSITQVPINFTDGYEIMVMQ